MPQMFGPFTTVSKAVHALVRESTASALPLEVRACARAIGRAHGIDEDGTWIVEQALVMVGARAGLTLKIGGDDAAGDLPSLPVPAVCERAAANSN